MEKLDECKSCGTILSYAWETTTCKDCLNRYGPELRVINGGKKTDQLAG